MDAARAETCGAPKAGEGDRDQEDDEDEHGNNDGTAGAVKGAAAGIMPKADARGEAAAPRDDDDDDDSGMMRDRSCMS
jgi:hypothetical protein